MKGSPLLAALVAFWLAAAIAPPAHAVDVGGSLRAWLGRLDAGGIRSDEEEQAFRLELTQDLTPWLTIFGAFRATNFRSSFDLGPAFERRSEQPEIGLRYGRGHLDARLVYSDRAIRTTDETQDLDIGTLLASLDWRPTRGPAFGLRYQDSTSTADAALFGRDSESRNFSARADYSKDTWNARYSFDLADVDNKVTGLSLQQVRHELRAGYFESLWQDRWSFAVDARYADVAQKQDAPSGSTVSFPVPVAQGLFTIDATPALGELEPAPDLIDGDTATPAATGIEIGGANTFRNVGVDLGINRAISELEITVDSPSGPLVWEVWESPDNSSWFQIGGVTASFDEGFLRYSIRFAETTNRYFKAVNVSVNQIPDVAVTEIRALLATAQLERTEGDGSEYWVNLQSNLQATQRIAVSVAANWRRDQDLVATDVRRDYDERGLSAQVRTELLDTLELRLGYRVTELDERGGQVIERREEVASAALDWEPLETVNLLLTAQQRDEMDGEALVSSTDSVILTAVTRIFPDLVVNSTLGSADTLNALFGFSQKTRYLIEAVDARPNDRWLLGGTFSRYEYDSVGRLAVSSRTSAQLRASWFATPFLSVFGDWLQSRDDLGDTATRRAGVQWAPGPKLSLSAAYYKTDTTSLSGTSNLSFDASYRLNRWLQAWLGLNEAESFVDTLEPQKTEALRLGLNAIF
jgi:hypothetical protein